MTSLPKSWATFRQIHKHSLPSFHVLKDLLLQEEVTRALKHAKEESKGILYTSQRGNFWNHSPRRYQGHGCVYQGPIVIYSHNDQQWQTIVHCHKCNKTGYIAHTCPQVEVERKIRDLHVELAKLKLESHGTANLTKEVYNEEAKEIN